MLLKKASKTEMQLMVETLLDAFAEDMLWNFISNFNKRVRELVFRFLIVLGLRNGKVFVSPGFEGVAVWLPSVSFWVTLRAAWKEIILCLFISPRGLFRTIQYLDFCTSIEDEVAPKGHWTLFPFGIAREYQRKGIGTSLMKESLSYFEEVGVPCYLDTDENTISFYERFGFVAAEAYPYQKGQWAFQVIPMLRSSLVLTEEMALSLSTV